MKPRIALLALLTALALPALPALAATPPATPGNVTVTYDHPDQFTEARKVRAMAPQLADDSYLKVLKTYIEKRAGKLLPPGDHLAIVVTDIDRAGNFEPWLGMRMQNVRIIKDIYPPRIDLNFTLTDASGKVVREGARKLRDPGFMMDTITQPGSDPLRYEKGLLNRWLSKGPDRW